MGNYCDWGAAEPESVILPPLTLNRNFIQDSWQLLKRHKQLTFITASEENEILSYLLSLPHRRSELKIIPIRAEQNIFIAYKYDAFFYLGQMGKDSIDGIGALALPDSKIFLGEFKNNRIEGEGQLIFPIQQGSNAKAVRIRGRWSEQIKADLLIETSNQSFPFTTTKVAIKQQKSLKYIQYPNYDEYLGETESEQAHGMGKYIYRSGQNNREYPCYEGMFKEGLREGRGVLRYSESEELSINWKKGKPDGVGFMQIGKTRSTVVYKSGQRINQLPSEVE